MKILVYSLVGLVVFGIIAGAICYITCLNHVAINEVGVAYNSMDGSITIQSNSGWYVTSPMVKVVTFSTLPIVVHIPSEAKVINTKIVRLNLQGLPQFIRLQGFSYTMGQNMENILMGYAFSGKQYPFLDILQEAGSEVVVTNK